MPNFHLTETTELFKNNLFSELEPLLKQEINWTTSDFNRLFKSYMNALLKSEFELFMKIVDRIQSKMVTYLKELNHYMVKLK